MYTKFTESAIDTLDDLRVMDVVNGSSDKSLYFTRAQISTLKALYDLLQHSRYMLCVGFDRTIRLETSGKFTRLTIHDDGKVSVFTC